MRKRVTNAGELRFLESRKTVLEAGRYTISVKQEITAPEKARQSFTARQKLEVAGERFSLPPGEVYSVFPPPGSRGEHSNVLPHLMLRRTTLPWERAAGRPGLPWLVLLVFHGGEAPEPKIVELKDLEPAGRDPQWPGVTLETGQEKSDRVAVIDVDKDLLRRLMPRAGDLKYLAHVRQGRGEKNEVTREYAVLLAHRLPEEGGETTVHLVSLEGRKLEESKLAGAGSVRLVSLHHWGFDCPPRGPSFSALLRKLGVSALRLPDLAADPAGANEHLRRGHVLLPGRLLSGRKALGWYHGPFIPGKSCDEGREARVGSAADLYGKDEANGFLDVSYAAAWQLGRLLALQDKAFALRLAGWKRSCAREEKAKGRLAPDPDEALIDRLLPADDAAMKLAGESVPAEIRDWFAARARLEGVPFGYLVPDEGMLPPESIRFFWRDPFWVECLLEGAFSLGPAGCEEKLKRPFEKPATVTGVLMRSQVVAGWPGLLVSGYGKSPEKPLPLLRRERLDGGVLLCLFAGEVERLEVYQRPEALHFGLEKKNGGLQKRPRDPKTGETEDPVDIVWRSKEHRILDVPGFAARLNGAQSSAAFALQMIEGSEKVRFEHGTGKASRER